MAKYDYEPIIERICEAQEQIENIDDAKVSNAVDALISKAWHNLTDALRQIDRERLESKPAKEK